MRFFHDPGTVLFTIGSQAVTIGGVGAGLGAAAAAASLVGSLTGPDASTPKLSTPAEDQTAAERSRQEAERKEQAEAKRRGGRARTLLTGTQSPLTGLATGRASLLGSTS